MKTKKMKMPTQCVNIRYLISPEMSPNDIDHRYYRRLRKYHLEKNVQLADGLFKTAHMQYIDDCDYLWELANLHSHLTGIPSPSLSQIFGWVLSTFVVIVMHFCHDNAAAMVQERLLPIYTGDPWRVWRRRVVQPMPSAAMANRERETLRRNELPKLRERLGDGPKLREQWDRVTQFFTAAIWLQLRVTRSPILNTGIALGPNGAGATGGSPQSDPWAIGQLDLDDP